MPAHSGLCLFGRILDSAAPRPLRTHGHVGRPRARSQQDHFRAVHDTECGAETVFDSLYADGHFAAFFRRSPRRPLFVQHAALRGDA